MKIAILSRAPESYSTRRLIEAARRRDHEVDVLDVFELAISLEESYPDLFHRGHELTDYDAVLPRIGASATFFGTAALRQFEQMGVFTANSALGILNSRDKLRSLQLLSSHDIGIPPTEFVNRKSDVLPAIERVGGAPVILKLLEGTQGIGVILAETAKSAETIIETLQSARQNVLIQRFVSESKGKDIRAFVIGDRVVAAVRRRATGDEFRSNIHRGANAEPLELDEEYRRAAVRAAQLMGLRIAGVDILEGHDGPKIMEVNSSPGLQGIETATRIDVAGTIIEYIEDQLQFPDLDIRERLTTRPGYGVAELAVPEASSLAGRKLRDSELRESDVVVLTISRNEEVLANPDGEATIEAGDRLLCFGKLTKMRQYMSPAKPRRLRKLRTKASGDLPRGL